MTLYLAILPTDEFNLREKFDEVIKEGTNIVLATFNKMLQDADWQEGDVLIVSNLVIPERGEFVEILHKAKHAGARIIYVGIGAGDAEEWKRVLVLNGVYDFEFFPENEIDLMPIKNLLLQPRTPRAVAAYFPASMQPPEEEITLVETMMEEKRESGNNESPTPSESFIDRSETARRKGRFRWGKKKSDPVHVVQPRMIVVVGIVPRAGASTVSALLAKMFATRLSSGMVGLVEHPHQWARMWDRFQLDERGAKPERYRHWLRDGDGHHVETEGIRLAPLPPGMAVDNPNVEQEMARYIFRQMRGTITILDAGQNTEDDLLFGMADRVIAIMDSDPTFLSIGELGKRYERLGQYREKLVTVLNKWSKHVRFPHDVFDNVVPVPYLSPDVVQEALWRGRFVDVSRFRDELRTLEKSVVDPLLPPPVVTLLHEHERYKIAATRDPLTGCLNRKGMEEWWENRKASTEWIDVGFVLCLFDLDNFKQLNDTQGHAMGDEALKAVSSAFRSLLSSKDVIIRLGGDEFVVIVESAVLGTDVQARLEGDKLKLPLQSYGLDMTMGVACYPEQGQTLEELLAYADERLYEGKRSGKGTIVWPITYL